MQPRPLVGEKHECPQCSQLFRVSAARDRVCPACRARGRRHPCADCGALCDWRATRCNLCAIKRTAASKVGNRTLHKASGYWLVKMPGHPNARADGYVREHVLVMADHIGRAIAPGEIVHHRNGDRGDNRLANLELMDKAAHERHHHEHRNPALAAFDLDRAARQYAEGWAMTEIAEEQGVSAKAVNNRLRKAGVEIRRKGWRGRARRVST